MTNRHGKSLVEVIVVIAIIGVLLGLFLPAVVQTRAQAVRLQNKNSLKQIVLAMHNYASASGGRFPGVKDPNRPSHGDVHPLYAILPHIDGTLQPPYYVTTNRGSEYPTIRLYLSPTDPSLGRIVYPESVYMIGLASYAANMTAFTGPPDLAAGFTDGTSATIAVVEHYCLTYDRSNLLSYPGVIHSPSLDPEHGGSRSATFADPNWFDVLPVTSGDPPRTVASDSGRTFQVAPRFEESDSRLPQATQPAGLLAAMFDGSIRTYGPSVTEHVFWGAVTPRGGEVLSE